LPESGERPDALLAGWQEYQREVQLRSQLEKERVAVLLAQDAASPKELKERKTDADNRAQALCRSVDELLDRHPALPGMFNDDTDAAEARYANLLASVDELRSEKATLSRQLQELEFALARLQGHVPINISAAEQHLLLLKEKHRRLEREAAALQIAHRELSAAVAEYSSAYRRELAEKTTAYLQNITGLRERFVEMDQSLSIKVREGGREVVPAQLSQGARDQLYLSLRLAIADLLSHGVRLPFVFDDPFLNWDAMRLEQNRQLLVELSRRRQIILFSHSAIFAPWGENTTIEVESIP
jgi:chromosome segregation protein